MSCVQAAGGTDGVRRVRRAALALCCLAALGAPGCGAGEKAIIPASPAPPPAASPRPLREQRLVPDADSLPLGKCARPQTAGASQTSEVLWRR
jgi:hypothetical protein